MDKIRITTDEVGQVDLRAPMPALSRPAAGFVGGVPAVKPGRSTVLWLVGAGVAAIVLVVALVALFGGGGHISLEEWKRTEVRQLNDELAHSSKVKAYIENIHPLVTYTGANVKSIEVMTVDGSEHTDKDGTNLSEVRFIVTYHWAGPVQKNGYTEVLHVYDMQSKQMKSSKYLDSTALVNLDNIDWFQLGWALGPYIFGS